MRVVICALAMFGGAAAFAPGPGPHAIRQRHGARTAASMTFVTHFEELSVETGRTISMVDLTPRIAEVVAKSGVKEGVVTVISKHSTVAVVVNEWEPRFVDDLRQFLLKLVPPNYPYLHNDLDYRVGPPDWPGGDEAWRAFRAKEPVNAHSHLIQVLMGTSESIPISAGLLKIGKYQNVIVIDADGPIDGPNKKRTIAVQVMGASS